MGLYRRVYFIGIAAYVLLLVLSLLFYKERVVSPDTSFYIYHIIRAGAFRIESFRFGDVFNQAFPLLAVKTGLPLSTVMVSYSLGYMVYYFICYLACGSILKRYDLALLVLLLNLLFATHTFYWIPSQLPQGIALLMVAFAFAGRWETINGSPLAWLGLIAMLFIVAFFHPLVLVVLVYSILFFLERRSVFVNKRLLFIIAGIFFAIIVVKPFVFRNEYEQHALGGLKNFVTLFPNYFSTYSTERFLHNSIYSYYWLPVLFVGIVIFYCISREWMKLGLFAICFCGYLLMVNVCFPTSATPVFYVENLYLPLSIMIGMPLVYDLLPVLDGRKLALPLMVLIIMSGCERIYMGHSAYTDRLDYERAYLDKYDNQKVLLLATQKDADVLQMLWSSPYEFLLLSAVERGKPASIRIDDHPETLSGVEQLRDKLLLYGDEPPYSSLPGKYFRFTDTVNGYRVILTR